MICPRCSGDFKPHRWSQKYCSPRCQNNAIKALKPLSAIKCINCGAERKTKRPRRALYCSPRCASAWHWKCSRPQPRVITCCGCRKKLQQRVGKYCRACRTKSKNASHKQWKERNPKAYMKKNQTYKLVGAIKPTKDVSWLHKCAALSRMITRLINPNRSRSQVTAGELEWIRRNFTESLATFGGESKTAL